MFVRNFLFFTNLYYINALSEREFMRKYAREIAFKLVYQYLITKEESPFTLEILTAEDSLDDGDIQYITSLYHGIIENYADIYRHISELSEDFKAERIFKADMAILVLAAYEILHLEDIPVKVSVSEAVELAKVYCTDKSPSFINGVLASFLQKHTDI